MFISSGEHSRTRAPGKAVISTKCHGPFEEWFTRRVRVGAWARARACVRPDVYNRWCTLWANARTYLSLGRQRVAPDGSNQCLLSKRHLGRADVRIPLPTTHDKTHLLVYGRRTMRSICSLMVASSGGSSHLDVRLLTTSDVNDLVSSSSVTVRSLIWGGVAVFAAPRPLGTSATSLDAVRLLTDSANCNHHNVESIPWNFSRNTSLHRASTPTTLLCETTPASSLSAFICQNPLAARKGRDAARTPLGLPRAPASPINHRGGWQRLHIARSSFSRTRHSRSAAPLAERICLPLAFRRIMGTRVVTMPTGAGRLSSIPSFSNFSDFSAIPFNFQFLTNSDWF